MQAFIKSSHANKKDWFGSRLSISSGGNTLAVGAQLENGGSKGINGNQTEDSGALYFVHCALVPRGYRRPISRPRMQRPTTSLEAPWR
jgi:hypothetical protein